MTAVRQRWIADALVLLAAAIWGTGILFQKQATLHVEPLTFSAARALLAALALAPLVFIEQRRQNARWPVGLCPIALLAALVFLTAGWLHQKGVATASVTNTGFLSSLYVIFTPLIAWAALGRRPTASLSLAILLSLSGAWLMTGGASVLPDSGDGFVICSSAFWALHLIVLSRAGTFDRPILFTFVQFLYLAAIAAAAAVVFEQPTFAGLLRAAPDIAFVGVLSTALTFTIFTYAVRHTPPSEAAILASTESLFAAAAGAIVLGERLAPMAWTGAGLILAAIISVQIRPGPGIGPAADTKAQMNEDA